MKKHNSPTSAVQDLSEEVEVDGRTSPSDVFLGREFGGFRVTREIALGGMATVFLAHKAGPGGFAQTAALKVIHPHLAQDREFVEMFLDEARIASSINHPNVCRVFDFGRAEGTYYLAMEHLMGETLSEVLAAVRAQPEGSRVLPELVAHVVSHACEGLHAAHEALDPQGNPLGVVHRDVSPQNILVGYDGSVRVLDFGIASAAERLHTTRNGAIKGRFSYMAPEQMRGLSVDRRADIWSLGVVLREGLTGDRLFRRDTDAETILAVTQDTIPPWKKGVEIPKALQRVTEKALQRELEARYGTAREMGGDLRRFCTSQVVPMGMPEVSVWMQRMFQRRIEQKRKMLQAAARTVREETAPPSFPPEGAGDPADSGPPTTAGPRSRPIPSVSAVRPRGSDDSRNQATDEYPAARRPRRLAPYLIVAALGALLGLLAWPAPQPVVQPIASPKAPQATGSTKSGAKVTQLAPQAQDTAEAKDTGKHTAKAPDMPEVPAAPPPATAPQAKESPSEDQVSPEGTPVARPKPRHHPAKRRPGTINVVTTNGWAEVYLGRRRLGTTPGRFTIPSGKQTLRLKPFGKGTVQKERVNVRPGKTTKVKIRLH